MRWPWTRDPHDRAANEQAEQDLRKVRGQWPRVHATSSQAVEHYRRNHIADALYAIFEGDGK